MSNTIPLHNALMKAGAPEEDARSAAESLAGADQVATKSDIARILTRMATKADMTDVRGEITIIFWMTTVAIALLIAISSRLFDVL